jgi:glycine cleavage system aminomethyltransferase T
MSLASRDTMLLTTPFHSRVAAMCDLNDWGNWMGYTTPNAYFDVELEYFALRSTTGVFDLSPMNKYRVDRARCATLFKPTGHTRYRKTGHQSRWLRDLVRRQRSSHGRWHHLPARRE